MALKQCKQIVEKENVYYEKRLKIYIVKVRLHGNFFLWFKVPLQRTIVDPILSATEQHFQTSLNGVFSFSISCFILEIFRFFQTCKLGVSDVIYSRVINGIYKMVNISVNNGQNSFKLCISIAILQLHTTIPVVWLQTEQFCDSSF